MSHQRRSMCLLEGWLSSCVAALALHAWSGARPSWINKLTWDCARDACASWAVIAADGDEGGRHQLINAAVSNGNLYILKVQVGDKRWFKVRCCAGTPFIPAWSCGLGGTCALVLPRPCIWPSAPCMDRYSHAVRCERVQSVCTQRRVVCCAGRQQGRKGRLELLRGCLSGRASRTAHLFCWLQQQATRIRCAAISIL